MSDDYGFQRFNSDPCHTTHTSACHAEKAFLRQRITELERQIAEHRCQLPPSIQEALNSGDGSYRP